MSVNINEITVFGQHSSQMHENQQTCTHKDKEGKKGKWLFRRASGAKDEKNTGDEEDVEGMRVDYYLVVFLKFIASIVPTIEVDSTTSF